MKHTNLIPETFNVGGQPYEVRKVERCDNNALGLSSFCGGWIEIADKYNKDDIQGEGNKVNTFFHEIIHIILDNMGEKELSANEKFVCTFAGFLTEAMTSAEYDTVAWIGESPINKLTKTWIISVLNITKDYLKKNKVSDALNEIEEIIQTMENDTRNRTII